MEKEEEMVQSEKCSQVSTANNGGANGENGIKVTQRKNTRKDTHWDFLDDIEAPMWADLTRECQAFYHDMDNEWFNISHPFHHCSSQQLISAFTRSGEGSSNLHLSVPVEYSPKLPCSVSKSRGKDYRIREWGQRKERLTFDLQQSVKNLKNKTVSIEVSRDKTSYGRPLQLAGSQMDSIGKSNSAEFEAQNDQSVPPLGDQKLVAKFPSFKGMESALVSTITSEGSGHEQQKSSEVSSQLSVQTSRFLSALKISLRKSCVTRQASRLQVIDGRQIEGRNSSSTKSSVGSSSIGCDGKDQGVKESKDETPVSRYVTMASSDKVNVRQLTSNPKLRTQGLASSSFKQQNTQGKRPVHAKALVPHRANERESSATTIKVKVKAVATSRGHISAVGKENFSKEMVKSKKSNTREKGSRDGVQVQKVMRRKLPVNSDKTKLVSQKEKANGKGEGESRTMTMTQRGLITLR